MNNPGKHRRIREVVGSVTATNRQVIEKIGLKAGVMVMVCFLSSLGVHADLQYTYTYDNNLLNDYCGERVFNKANAGAIYSDGKLFGAAIIRSNTDEMYWFRGNRNSIVKVFRFSGNQGYQFSVPYDIVINSAGEAYVTEKGNDRVIKLKMNLEGGVINVIKVWGAKEENKVDLSDPHGIALDRDENVYVADTGNGRVVVFDKDGKVKKTIGRRGSGDAEFDTPVDVAVSRENIVTVADAGSGMIKQFGADGIFLR